METDGDGALTVVPVRHYWRWVASVVVLVLVAMLVHTIFSKVPSSTGQMVCTTVNGVKECHPLMVWRFSWNIVGQYFTTSYVLQGLGVTLELTFLSMFIGITLGIVLAVMRLSPSRLLSSVAWTYTWFFRGTPVYVQLFFWFSINSLYESFRIGIPFTSIDIIHFQASAFFTPFVAALTGLSLNEGAYMSEIARSGLISVDEGQTEAATSLGMTRGQTLRFVVLPQAMRVIVPPTGNELISMLKTSSLVSAVGVVDLFGATNNIAASNYEFIPLLIVASIWYLIVTTFLSIGQYYVERRFARGALRTPPPTPIARLKADVKGIVSKMRTPRVAKGTSA